MELTKEIINELELTYGSSIEDGWKRVSKEFSSYDEGVVTHRYIFQNIETEEYWAFYESSNSWVDDSYEYDEEPTRVYPREVTVIEYFDKP